MDCARSDRVSHPISEAIESDAQAIADVHMAAFENNGMLLAQFPTPTIREQLRLCVARKVADDIRDPKIVVLVIYCEKELISFAKWSLPLSPFEKYEEASWVWPEEADFAVLERWTERVLAARGRVMGDRQCYGISFIATLPKYERQGAASALIKWGIDKCTSDGLPIYLESTLTAAPLYEKLGFKAMEKITLPLDGTKTYEEIGFLYEP